MCFDGVLPNTHMKNIKNSIKGLALRVSRRDITAIYACALADVALTAIVIASIVWFI